jgi:hypothetical protein
VVKLIDKAILSMLDTIDLALAWGPFALSADIDSGRGLVYFVALQFSTGGDTIAALHMIKYSPMRLARLQRAPSQCLRCLVA